MLNEKRGLLLTVYRAWEKELREICPQLVCETYSHPYYLHIPEDWFDRKYRILILGEEGFGDKQFDLPIEKAQEFNRDYLAAQWDRNHPEYNKRSPFWRRIRNIAGLFEPGLVSITWTNLDMIHLSRRGRCQLREAEQIALHSTPTKILREEIHLLQPTHVIWLGWYGISLKMELPEVHANLYRQNAEGRFSWQDSQFEVVSYQGIVHVFTYHPSWGQRQKGYEAAVLERIRQVVWPEE